jgi:O-antigen/teichoic acid export membrane protein
MTTTECAKTSSSESILRPALLLMSGRTLAFAATFCIPVVLARVFNQTEFGTYKQLFLIQSTVLLMHGTGWQPACIIFCQRLRPTQVVTWRIPCCFWDSQA